MKRILFASASVLLIISILLATPAAVLASEGDDEHQLEVEVGGYHVTLASEHEWTKGENIIVVTITDDTGMPVSKAQAEILITSTSNSGHAEPASDSHGAEAGHGSMPGMEESEPPEAPAHDQESAGSMAMMESRYGTYIAKAQLESSGTHQVQVFFHVNGEMLEANFEVEVSGTSSKTIVLWSFAVVNAGLVTFAGLLRRQPVTEKGNG